MDWLGGLLSDPGTLLVTTISTALAFLWTRIRDSYIRWSLAVVVPFVITWTIYWMPVWRGSDPSEYSAWFLVCAIPWHSAGAAASMGVVLIFGRRTR